MGMDIDEEEIARHQAMIADGTYKPYRLDLEKFVPLY